MFTRPEGKSIERQTQTNGNVLEPQYCESTSKLYQTIHASGLNRFTHSLLDSWWDQLSVVVYSLEGLPGESLKEMMVVVGGLRAARNELRDACFLFDVGEIHPVHRLILRNRSVIRGKEILWRVIQSWPHR